ncbi:MAG: hypothetical protein PHF63_09650 [Herbinix sp.]|nr:hypothetical protein [Herbinix sp.]
MYFEPAKKTYYRFPSSSSINNLDSRYYFPEKTHSSGEDTRFESQAANYVINSEKHYDA